MGIHNFVKFQEYITMEGLEAVGQSYALMPYWRSARIKNS
jgi:hypothetical protein